MIGLSTLERSVKRASEGRVNIELRITVSATAVGVRSC